MAIRWTEAQDACLRANLHLTDDEIAVEVSKLGPERNSHAVKNYRWKHRLLTSAPQGQRTGALKAAELAAGWPRMVGSEEARHERYCALVWSEFARLYPEKVAA